MSDHQRWETAMREWERGSAMHLRDTFAAAALTGLLAAPTDKDRSSEYWARFSYEIADAMLRERVRSGVTEPMPKEKRAEVPDGSEPVAFAVVSDSTEQIDCEFVYPDEATAGDVALESNGGVVALYRQPHPTITDAERDALRDAADAYGDNNDDDGSARIEDALRGLLERTGGGK